MATAVIDHDAGSLSCPVCGAADRIIKTDLTTSGDSRDKGTYFVFLCSKCGNGFTAPEVPDELYKLPPDIPRHSLSGWAQSLLSFFMQRRVARIRIEGVRGRECELLDIGGGSCAFANLAARGGFDVTVIEPNGNNSVFADTPHHVKFVAQHFTPALLEQGFLKPNSFDIVTMWHSLEHFPHPGETLQLLFRLLKPGGIVLISVPNIQSSQARFGNNFWAYLDVPHHLIHFTPRGLAWALEQTGFVPLRSFPVSLEYDVFGWYQTWLNVLSRSYNYFYNRTKKNRLDEDYLPYPVWAKILTRMGIVLLPLVLFCSAFAALVKSPSCVEVIYRRPK